MRTKRASAMLMAALAASLLATAAAVMLIEARSARAASGETLRLARAEQQARALLALAIVRLDVQDPIATQGVLFSDSDGARVLRQDAAGLVDVNTAPAEVLTRLITGLGTPADDAATLADRIADWRDEDDLRRTHGAESRDYASASLPAPENRPFVTEGELIAVMGATPALVACLAPYLTTYAGAAEIDAARAPPRLAQLVGASVETQAPSAAPPGAVIILTAVSPFSDSAVLRRTIWIRLTGDGQRPFWIHRASQNLAPVDEEPPSCAESAA